MHNLLKLTARTAGRPDVLSAAGGRCREEREQDRQETGRMATTAGAAGSNRVGKVGVAKPALWQAGVAENKMVAEFMKGKT